MAKTMRAAIEADARREAEAFGKPVVPVQRVEVWAVVNSFGVMCVHNSEADANAAASASLMGLFRERVVRLGEVSAAAAPEDVAHWRERAETAEWLCVDLADRYVTWFAIRSWSDPLSSVERAAVEAMRARGK